MRTFLMYLDGALCGPGPLMPRYMVWAFFGNSGFYPMTSVVFRSRRNAEHWIDTIADKEHGHRYKVMDIKGLDR